MVKEVMRRAGVSFFTALKGLGYVPPERVFRHLHHRKDFDLILPNGSSIRLRSWGNRVENELYWRGWDGHERDTRRRWASMVARGGDVFDVGANTGTFAFIAKGLSPESRVYAFEPLTRIADMIRENCEVSGLDVEVIESALSDSCGTATIYDPGGRNAYSASLDANFLTTTVPKQSYSVPVTMLDVFCEEVGAAPASVKIDVEGLELAVISGAKHTLSKCRPLIICEVLERTEANEELYLLLKNLSYAALDVKTLERIDKGGSRRKEERNLLLVPFEILDEIQAWPRLT